MNLRGILIEYFITGGFALIWVYLILKHTGIYSEIKEIDNKVILGIFAISSVYMIGLIVDHIGKYFTEAIRYLLVNVFFYERLKEVENKSFSVAQVYFLNSELGKQYEMRSSRDRIARGSIINILFLTIVLLYFLPQESNYFSYTSIVGSVLFFLFIMIWVRFQYLSGIFLRQCKELFEKN